MKLRVIKALLARASGADDHARRFAEFRCDGDRNRPPRGSSAPSCNCRNRRPHNFNRFDAVRAAGNLVMWRRLEPAKRRLRRQARNA
jgi:hypothetical protein